MDASASRTPALSGHAAQRRLAGVAPNAQSTATNAESWQESWRSTNLRSFRDTALPDQARERSNAMPPSAPRTLAYGSLPEQVGDLYLPDRTPAPVVVLLHGGFWRMPYGRDQMSDVAGDLQARGYAVWNVGYRRVALCGGGWPESFDDAAAGVASLATLPTTDVDASRTVICGHSAGGTLALWVAARHRELPGVQIRAAVSLAGIGDLARAHALALGGGAVDALLCGSPAEVPERYAAASPASLLPLGVRQLLLHGTEDDAVPIALARAYADAAARAGDEAELLEIPSAGHMEFVNPATAAYGVLTESLRRLLEA